MFRAAVVGDLVFACAVNTDDMHHVLDKVAEYNTFCDSFLVLLMLQSMYAFLLFPSAHLSIFC